MIDSEIAKKVPWGANKHLRRISDGAKNPQTLAGGENSRINAEEINIIGYLPMQKNYRISAGDTK